MDRVDWRSVDWDSMDWSVDGCRVGDDRCGMGYNGSWMGNWSWVGNTLALDVGNVAIVVVSAKRKA